MDKDIRTTINIMMRLFKLVTIRSEKYMGLKCYLHSGDILKVNI